MTTLSAPARAILAFTLAVTLAVTGWSIARQAVASLAVALDVQEPRLIAILIALVPLALAVWSYLLARGVVRTTEDEVWPDHLADATQLLSLVLIAVFALQLLAAVVGDNYGAGSMF